MDGQQQTEHLRRSDQSPLPSFLDLHPFVRQTVVDRIRGTFVGAALGDCIGLYTEFLDASTSEAAYPDARFTLTGRVTRFRNDDHRNKFTEGSWTDDTDHSLLITLLFLHGDGKIPEPDEFAARLRIWIEQGLRCLDRLPLGLGRTTGSIVTSGEYLQHPAARSIRYWANTTFQSAPNGSLMRTYPLGIICLRNSLQETFQISADFSIVTHSDPRCIASCCLATAIIRDLILGDLREESDIDRLVQQTIEFVKVYTAPSSPFDTLVGTSCTSEQLETYKQTSFDPEEFLKHTNAESYSILQLDDMRKQGYVYKCLGAGILCLRLALRRLTDYSRHKSIAIPNHQIFEDLVTELVFKGGDADTNGTVAGAFLGCLLGFSVLPRHWYEGVQNIDWLMTKADAVIDVLEIDHTLPGYEGSKDLDTGEDGGKGLLSDKQLRDREKAFMEMYLTKSAGKLNKISLQTNDGNQGLFKRWKGIFA